MDTGGWEGPIDEVDEVVEMFRTVQRIEAGISGPRILCFFLIVADVGKELSKGLRAPTSKLLLEQRTVFIFDFLLLLFSFSFFSFVLSLLFFAVVLLDARLSVFLLPSFMLVVGPDRVA